LNIALGKPLINVLWVKRVLFRCDRKYLRKQTKNAFNEFVWEPIYVVGYAMGLGHWLLRCRACGVQASPDAIVADGRALASGLFGVRSEITLKASPARSMNSCFVEEGYGFEFCSGLVSHPPGAGR
jgi:hypothetical protein